MRFMLIYRTHTYIHTYKQYATVYIKHIAYDRSFCEVIHKECRVYLRYSLKNKGLERFAFFEDTNCETQY